MPPILQSHGLEITPQNAREILVLYILIQMDGLCDHLFVKICSFLSLSLHSHALRAIAYIKAIALAVPNVPNAHTNRQHVVLVFPIGLRKDDGLNMCVYIKYVIYLTQSQCNEPTLSRRYMHSVTVRSIVRIKSPPRRRPYNSAARSSP